MNTFIRKNHITFSSICIGIHRKASVLSNGYPYKRFLIIVNERKYNSVGQRCGHSWLLSVPVHGGATVGAGVVAVRHVLLTLHEVTAGALEYQLVVLPLVVLHHLGEGQRLVGEGFPDGRHELRVLG